MEQDQQDRIEARKLWEPRMDEVPVQCASCPFREGNHDEFGQIVARLHQAANKPPPERFDIGYSRIEVRKTAMESGELACHCTSYTANMGIAPYDQHRQCKGASEAYRAGRTI
jgi:hypothetical protein